MVFSALGAIFMLHNPLVNTSFMENMKTNGASNGFIFFKVI
jgi:hypothetical protein